MKQISGLVLGLIAMVLVQSCQSNKRANNYNNKPLVDNNGLLFFTNATETALTTVKVSGLAISNSKNQEVIQFAKKMIDDHTRLAVDLKKLQTDNFVTSEDSINTLHQQMITGLEKKRAAAFDKAYMQEMVAEHEQQVGLFNAASRGKNINISDFATKQLPSLKSRLDSARMINVNLK